MEGGTHHTEVAGEGPGGPLVAAVVESVQEGQVEAGQDLASCGGGGGASE